MPRTTRIAMLMLPLLLPLIGPMPAAAQQKPYAIFTTLHDTTYWYDAAPVSIPVRMGPPGATVDVSPYGGGSLESIGQWDKDRYEVIFTEPQPGITSFTIRSIMKRVAAVSDHVLVVEKPTLRYADTAGRNGTAHWGGLRARVGERYDPSSEWGSIHIPEDNYQTVVTMRGVEVMNAPGTNFHDLGGAAAGRMIVDEGTRPEDIVTKVYWRPGGTPDPTQWKLLLSNQEEMNAIVPNERRMVIERPEPRMDGARAHKVIFSPGHLLFRSDTLAFTGIAVERIHPECGECKRLGIRVSLERVAAGRGALRVEATDFATLLKHRKEIDRGTLRVLFFNDDADIAEEDSITLYPFISEED